MFKQSMMTLSALTVLVALSGVAKAEGDGYQQLTCDEATQVAWFNRQMQLTDGDTSPDVQVPAECNRELIAAAADASAESK